MPLVPVLNSILAVIVAAESVAVIVILLAFARIESRLLRFVEAATTFCVALWMIALAWASHRHAICASVAGGVTAGLCIYIIHEFIRLAVLLGVLDEKAEKAV